MATGNIPERLNHATRRIRLYAANPVRGGCVAWGLPGFPGSVGGLLPSLAFRVPVVASSQIVGNHFSHQKGRERVKRKSLADRTGFFSGPCRLAATACLHMANRAISQDYSENGELRRFPPRAGVLIAPMIAGRWRTNRLTIFSVKTSCQEYWP